MAIGKAKVKNLDQFLHWLTDEGMCWGYENRDVDEILNITYGWREKSDILRNLYEESRVNPYFQTKNNNTSQADAFKRICQYAEEYQIPFELIKKEKNFGVIRFGTTMYVLPSEYLEITEYTDYSELSLAQMRLKTDTGTALSIPDETVSVKETRDAISSQEEAVQKLMNEKEALERQQKKELERIKAEIEEKYRKQKEILNAKKQELDGKIETLRNQLFILNTEIYAIQCFTGETVTFTRLRSGKPAAIEEPVLLHQKIRYLDEELARMISVYEIRENQTGIFEEYLKNCDYAAEFFAPGDKSINLIQLSRTGKSYTKNSTFPDMLEEYELYHANMVGILIRNGENLYIGWTDADRISIEDENLYYTPKKSETAYDENDRAAEKKLKKEDVASKYFIYSILQGILHKKEMLEIPEQEYFLKGGGKYILFNATDALIEDNRFGTFEEIIKRCNSNIQRGDVILTVQHLYDTDNNRGTGWQNRTYDVSLEDANLYKINLVEKEEYPAVEYEYCYAPDNWAKSIIKRKTLSEVQDSLAKNVRNVRQITRTVHYYYISLEKEFSEAGARANFELKPYEFINLTFLNSVWVKYAIQNKKVGRLVIGGIVVSYAYAMRYLNKALEYLKEREKTEAALLSKYMELPEEWEVSLSEWKLEKNVHEITDYQAKRFAKYMALKDKFYD